MITDFIITAFLAGIDALVSLFPTVTFLTNVNMGVKLPADINRIIPLNFILATALICLGIRLALDGWDAVVWVYHQFWGSS